MEGGMRMVLSFRNFILFKNWHVYWCCRCLIAGKAKKIHSPSMAVSVLIIRNGQAIDKIIWTLRNVVPSHCMLVTWLRVNNAMRMCCTIYGPSLAVYYYPVRSATVKKNDQRNFWFLRRTSAAAIIGRIWATKHRSYCFLRMARPMCGELENKPAIRTVCLLQSSIGEVWL